MLDLGLLKSRQVKRLASLIPLSVVVGMRAPCIILGQPCHYMLDILLVVCSRLGSSERRVGLCGPLNFGRRCCGTVTAV